MNEIIDARIEAAKRFNPKRLCKNLTRTEDGVVIVDRSKCVHTMGDERLFMVSMNADYGWDFSDYQNSTIYLQIDGNDVIGGIYNTASKDKKTRRVIAVVSDDGLTRRYVYSLKTMAEMCSAITNA